MLVNISNQAKLDILAPLFTNVCFEQLTIMNSHDPWKWSWQGNVILGGHFVFHNAPVSPMNF